MADAEERLAIQVEAEVSDLRARFQEVRGEIERVSGVTDRARQRTDQFTQSLERQKRTARVLGDVFGKFATRLPAFLAADFTARVLGFSSIMGAINEGLDAAADKVREFFKRAVSGATAASEEAAKFAKQLRELEAQAVAARDKNIAKIADFGFDTSIFSPDELARVSGALAAELEKIESVQKRLQLARAADIRTKAFDPLSVGEESQAVRDLERELAGLELTAGRVSDIIFDLFGGKFETEVRKAADGVRDVATAFERFKSQRVPFLDFSSTGIGFDTVQTTERLGADAIEEENKRKLELVAANLQVTASQADLLRGRQRERAEIELGLRARELEIAALFATGKINEQQAQELQRNAQLLRELQLDELIVDFQRASDAAEDFGAGVREGLREAIESFDTLREQGRFVGSALIDSLGFSITSTFDQIAEGSIKAKDFFSAFAESMLRDIGRIIAQLFAMRLAQSLVGFFAPTPSGDGGGGGPFSSIARAFASGGAAPENLGVTPTTTGRSAQPITVNINLGEGADGSEVVRQLPRIKEAITAGLRGGDRNLILAVRGAVS